MSMAVAAEQKRVLVVEDESLVAFDIEKSLTSQGYFVTGVVASGEEAVEQADLFSPDIVLMDIRLKGEMDGIQAAQRIREKNKIPVIFLTAHADEATLQRAMVAEPYGYIMKPFEHAELRAMIELSMHRYRAEKQANQQKAQQQQGRGEAKSATPVNGGARPVPVRSTPLPPKIAESPDAAPLTFLKRLSPFDTLPETKLKELAAACQVVQVKSGELIAYEGEETWTSFIVMSGRVALVKTSMNGKELIVELLPPGDLFSLIMAIQQDPASLTARAQVDSQILKIPTANFLMILDQHAELYRSFVEEMAQRLRSSHDFARGLAHDRVEVRIASALCALVPRFAKNEDEAYTIMMTRQEIADLTGTTPETAIRTTKAMERLELLSLERPGVIKVLDLEGLQELAEEV